MFGRRKSWKGWSVPFVMSAAHGEREFQRTHAWKAHLNNEYRYYFTKVLFPFNQILLENLFKKLIFSFKISNCY